MTSPAILSPTHTDKRLVETQLEYLFQFQTMPQRGPVSEAMRYAVFGSAQRIRPILALRVARLFGSESRSVLRGAAAVELIHCASLIIDDLPCMDDELLRRECPAVHVAYGQASAILAAFALVALAARVCVQLEVDACERERLYTFQDHLLQVLDVGSLIAGQSLDLELRGEQRELHRERMTNLKTVPLFTLAARAAMLGTEISSEEEDRVLDFASMFGLCFQMSDDLLDGEERDDSALRVQLERARTSLRPYGKRSSGVEELIDYLHAQAPKNDRCHR